MKRKITVALSLVLIASVFAGAARSQDLSEPSVSVIQGNTELNANSNESLYKQLDNLSIKDSMLWIFLALATGSGAFGGLVYYLMNFKEIQETLDEEAKLRKLTGCPRQMNYRFANTMCCISKMSIGAAAAPAAILLLRPESPFALIATSIVVGSAGSAVLQNVQEKMMATIAKTKAEQEATRQQALILNREQSIEVGRLIEIAKKESVDEQDWRDVREIAEILEANCRTCHATFSKFNQDKKLVEPTEELSSSEKKSLNGAIPQTEIGTVK